MGANPVNGVVKASGPRSSEPTRRAIVDAAVELFASRGFDGTSVQEIVERAGVTKGAFYHHFASKRALLQAIHDKFIDHSLRGVHAILDSGLPADQMLRAFAHNLVDGVRRFKPEHTIFFGEEDRLVGTPEFEEIRAKRDEWERCLVEVVDRGVQDGLFRDAGTARLVAFGVVGMCAWTYQWLDPRQEDADEIGDLFADLLLDGLRGDRAPAAAG